MQALELEGLPPSMWYQPPAGPRASRSTLRAPQPLLGCSQWYLFRVLGWGSTPHPGTSQPNFFLPLLMFPPSVSFCVLLKVITLRDLVITKSKWVILQRTQGTGKDGARQERWAVRGSVGTRGGGCLPSLHFSGLILQIDFPTSAFDIKFTSPTGDKFSPRYEFGSLREEDQRKLKDIMQKESLHW